MAVNLQALPEYIYYNVNANNNATSGVGISSDPVAKTVDNRTGALLAHPEHYLMTVARFQLPLGDVPLGLIPIQTGQGNVNLTALRLHLAYNGTTQSTAVIWSPQVLNQATPSPPLFYQDVATSYYYYYSVNWVLDLLNATLKTCLADLITATGGGASPIAAANTPFFQLDTQTHLFSLYAEKTYFEAGAANFISITLNNNLQQRLTNFMGTFNSDPDTSFTYTVKNLNNLNGATVNAIDYWVMPQETPNLQQWNECQSIVITTNLPVIQEAISPSSLYGSNTSTLASSNASMAILTDFDLDQADGTAIQSGIAQFTPSGQFRYSSMARPPNPITSINCQFWWADRNYNLRPVRLGNQTAYSIKIQFKRRDV